MATVSTKAIPPAGDASTILAKVTMTNNSITFTLSGGTPADGASIAYYRINFDRGGYKRVSNPVTFTGLSPETSYHFEIDFVDNYGTVASGKKTLTVITARYSVDDANNINVSASSTSNSITISLSGGTPIDGTSIAYYIINFRSEGYKKVSNPATFTDDLIPNKTYHFYVGFVDSDGHIARGNIVHSVTTKSSLPLPPTKGTVSVSNITYNGAKFTWSGFSFGSGATWGKYQYSWDNSSWNDCGTNTSVIITNRSPNTSYTFYVRMVDNYGQVSDSATVSFTTAKPPAGDATGILINATSTSNSVTISLSGGTPADGASIAYYRIDFNDSGYKRVSNPVTFTDLSPGTTYYFRVDFIDSYGNIASGSTAGSVTTKNSLPLPPTKGTVSVSNITYNGAKFTWSGFSFGAGATWGKYQYKCQDQDWIDCGTNTSVTITDRSPNTSYAFYVRLVDNYGQASDSATVFFATSGSSVSDASNINISVSSTNNSATISLSGGTPADGASIAYYRISFGGGGYYQVSNPVTFTDLSPGTTYYFRVDFIDSYGNIASGSTAGSVTTKNSSAPTKGRVSVSNITYNGAKFTWSGFSLGVGATLSKYQYSWNNSSWTDCGTNTSITITDRSPNTSYTFYVRLVDNYGQASDSATVSFTTKKPAAPTKGTVSASNITYNGAKLSWSGFSFGAGGTWGKYQYSWDNSSWNDCGQNTSLTFTDRSPNTTYNFYVRLVDKCEQASAVASTSFTTSKPSAPSKGTITVSNITESSATFMWSGFRFADGANWGYYRYSLDGSNWTKTKNFSDVGVTLTSLSANTSYTFYVQLVDNYGQASATAYVTFKTKAIKDWKYGVVYIKVNDKWKYGIVYYKVDDIWRTVTGTYFKGQIPTVALVDSNGSILTDSNGIVLNAIQ